MKNKKGFTLIELLAIIVILAIIAVITVPIILNIIENAKKGAATNSAYGYKDAVQKFYMQELQNHNNLKLNDTYTVENDGSLSGNFNDPEVPKFNITVSGTVPSSGSLTYSNNVLTEGWLVIGDYIVTFDSNGTVTTAKNNGSSSNEQNNDNNNNNSEPVEPLEIGQTVNYITSLNGVTLDNWKVFYVDGNYTYIILADYLPNSAISSDMISTNHLEKCDTYGVHLYAPAYGRDSLINAMTTKSNWDSLLTGSINNHEVSETRTENIWAMGAPTIELWVNSWNAKYPNDALYTRYIDTEDIDNENFCIQGYAIGNATPIESVTYASLENKTGYNDTLYFPYQAETVHNDFNYYGYWLASPSAGGYLQMWNVSFYGDISNEDSDEATNTAFRPVICLPSSVLSQ